MQLPKIIFLSLLSALAVRTNAQDSSLLNRLNDSMNASGASSYVTGTFKATHVVNMQTVEGPAKGALIFLIQHRFGQINSGSYNFFGLDNATLRLGFDFGITDRFVVGIGRSSYLKTYDGFLKYKLLRQSEGASSTPVTLSVLGVVNIYTVDLPFETYINGTYRTSYATQILIARKFTSSFSLQLSPTWLHYNVVPDAEAKNDLFAVAVGGRMKISKRMSINAEYNYLASKRAEQATPEYDSFSLGWDIETGGHVFQLVFSNSQSMAETQYIPHSTGSWGKGGIYFGFNLSRTFNLKKH
jgi:hypothetical protein